MKQWTMAEAATLLPGELCATGRAVVTPAEHWSQVLDTAGIRLGTRPGRHAGGEWDAWRALPARTRRRIIGLGWAGARGMAPDRAAHALGLDDPCELVHQLASASRSAGRWRTERQAASRQRRAVAELGRGATYHRLRERQAQAAGWASYRAYRRSRGWSG